MKQMKPFAGKWRIVEMEVWDQDYVDMEVPGYIRIGSDGTGRFQFGLVSGDTDGRVEQCGNAPRFKFSWSGQKAISDYKKAIGRPEGLAELTVFYCESCMNLLGFCGM
jgi:hypothetical protein